MYQFKNWKLICEEKDREIARLKEELERVNRVERLTEKDGKWIGCKLPDGEKCPPYELCECEHFHKMRNKLAEYEDLEEQGLLLKLPCKVGDKLYKPYYFNRKAKGIDTIVVSNMVVEFDSEEGERAYIVGHYENTNCGVDADFSEIGEVVHIHKAEAEKALAEMEKYTV